MEKTFTGMRWIAACAAFCATLAAAAPAPPAVEPDLFVLRKGADTQEITGALRVLPDPGGALTLDEARSPAMAGRYTDHLPTTPGVKFYWVRVRVRNESGISNWYLWVYPYMEFWLYEDEGQGRVRVRRNGIDVTSGERATVFEPSLVEVEWPAGEVKTVFVRTATLERSRYSDLRIQARLISVAPIQRGFFLSLAQSVFVAGIILVMAVYNLILFFYVRDKSYLYYSLGILAVALYLMCMDYTIQYLTRVLSNTWNTQVALASAGLMAFVSFTRHYLDAPRRFRGWNRYLLGLTGALGLVLAFIAVRLIFPGIGFLGGLDNYLYLLVFFSLIVFGFHAWRRRFRPALYYLQTSLVFLVFITAWVTGPRFLKLLDLGYFSVISLKLGVVLQVVLFSIALAARINLLRKEVEEEREAREETERRKILEIQQLTEQKNVELEQKVEERTAEVVRQKDEIQRKNVQITAGINYARRIQVGVLPPKEELDGLFREHFVFFRPKDIVSGDFYWMKRAGDQCVVAVADCTGHGVPGALMSMLGITLLNEVVTEDRALPAGEILDQLGQRVRRALRQTGRRDEAKDGLNIGLLVVGGDPGEVQFAGAYHPLYLVRQGTLTQVKSDRQPVGISRKDGVGFTTHRVAVLPDDRLYLASDGFSDQFGGTRGEKFSRRRFRQLLVDIHAEPMERQREALERTFESWRSAMPGPDGVYDQVDDVLVMGFRVQDTSAGHGKNGTTDEHG
ncbi:MAG: SpoIIE family protein phosphatase [Acidobacteria bacterium]|nr:SpoIIE family protein phosphatase [Acidobacteriota bacterium]